MPLTLAGTGVPLVIQRIGGNAELKQHLSDLGFVVGGEVTVISTSLGNVIVKIKDSRVAISKVRKKAEGSMTLKDLRPGQSAVVKKLTGEGAVKRRIMDMGLTKGAELFVRKVAPLGDPLEITVRGYELSVRKADAEMIEVEEKV